MGTEVTRWLRPLALLCPAILGVAVGVAAEAPVLSSRPIVVPYQATAQGLQQELARLRAELVGLRADIATCQANTEQAKRETQSLLLTTDVDRAVKELQTTFPGSQWYWDNDTRRIKPVVPAPALKETAK
jgi:hypothetical protein